MINIYIVFKFIYIYEYICIIYIYELYNFCETFRYYYLFYLQTESILNAPKAAKTDHKLQCLRHSLLYS